MSRLRWRLTGFGMIFVITTLITYRVLTRVSSIFGPWNAEDFPGERHFPQMVRLAELNKPRARDLSEKQGDSQANDILGAPQQKCSTTLTILIPGVYPFKAWREYRPLWEEFAQRSTKLAGTDVRTLRVQCPRHQCDLDIRVTMEERHLNASDAILVNMFPNILKDQLLDLLSHLRQVLHPRVHWFFYGVESPQMMTFWDPNIGEIKYHHSMTYHSQADIRLPYGEYLPDRHAEASPRDWSAGKTALISWMASNCHNTFWPRQEFVQELAKHIPIDIYGQCGTLSCLPALSENCTRLMARYKFYLSLENAECEEYITEKVWSNGFRQGVVPVVYGGRKETYERLLPPKSFIHIGDFDSAQNLAAYLSALDRDNNMYNQYHAWRRLGSVAAVYPPLEASVFCGVVPFVLQPPPPFRMVRNSGYYRGCKSLTGKFAESGSLKSFVPWTKD